LAFACLREAPPCGAKAGTLTFELFPLDMKPSFLTRIFILGLCTAGLFFLPHCSKEKTQPSLGLAPDFTLKTLDGKEITLSQLKGKVVLLDFWATWCGSCKESIPHLIQLYKSYRESGFELLGMNVDRGDAEVVRRFVKAMDIPYPIVTAPEDMVRSYRVTGIPTTFLIDKEGKIRDRMAGFNSTIAQQLTTKVADLTSEKP
jgi:cytochrome c biogenesis protein CcmG/thiol:disulfide interchange protein DsbE